MITPITKSSPKDPLVPLNYRGISLLSCLYKIYSSLLNSRLSNQCEENNRIVDEKNGFRPCLDHLYVISSIIRNRLTNKESTYAIFNDMKKAFDWIDRDMLLFKLMNQFDIRGRLFEAIRCIYYLSSASLKVTQL